jgi:hypothetical protein
MKKTKSIFLVFVMFFPSLVCLPSSYAQVDGSKPSATVNLTGSDFSDEKIITNVGVIFVGKIEKMGLTSVAAPGRAALSRIIVKVIQLLRGSVRDQITVRMDVRDDRGEVPPLVGDSYIFFGNKEGASIGVLKLLPATQDTIAKVKALIATEQ